MYIVYPYNPLLKQALTASIQIPFPPLLQQMAWQLLGSLILVLLLVILSYLPDQDHSETTENRRNEKKLCKYHDTWTETPVQTLKCVLPSQQQVHAYWRKSNGWSSKGFHVWTGQSFAYLAKVRDATRADYEHTPLHIRTFDLRETVDKLTGWSMFLPIKGYHPSALWNEIHFGHRWPGTYCQHHQ